MTAIDQAEKQETRQSLRTRIANEKKQVEIVQKHLDAKEEQTAKKEIVQLAKDLETVQTKSLEDFILDKDVQLIEELKEELVALDSSKKVKPVRSLANDVEKIATDMDENQSELLALSSDLKLLNQTIAELAEKKYLPAEDKELLVKDQIENAKYFEDASDFEVVEKRKIDSQTLVDRLEIEQEKNELDFKKNEKAATEIIQATVTLLSNGNLTSEEIDALNEASKNLSASLALTDYKPADLVTDSQVLQSINEEYLSNSNQRIAEAKEKAEQEAAEKAAQEEKLTAQQNNASATSEPTLSGGWYQAPAGYKFLKVSSGKTYGQVKEPANYKLITVAEAASYSPGHGNGYAKQ